MSNHWKKDGRYLEVRRFLDETYVTWSEESDGMIHIDHEDGDPEHLGDWREVRRSTAFERWANAEV